IAWLAMMVALQSTALGCLWALQRLSLPDSRWGAIVMSQLAGGALAKVAPGGGMVGGALQYRMLVSGGLRPRATAAALTTVNLLTFAVVLALPVLAIPAIVRGTVDRNLVEAAIAGAGAFAVLLGLSIACALFDAPLSWIGRTIQRLLNAVSRRDEPRSGLPRRLLRERDRIMGTLGPRYRPALAATIGRWAFDYATLLAALAAVGSHPSPSLVLLAFCAAQLLGQIPITPGGLGFVEAGLTAMLELAGVSIGNAVLATFAYRLVAYWLPLPAGIAAYALHRRSTPARPAA
ncbi:MAG TPA: lysylphosphatidylglycerol synthase transmembrane domain-containing protein, partial [Solirubrobacteraceae bacterium]|nr:lysylphosphatidylglycerol synthase transmembrane domain-containing protein [Solirubrobacteraceae bacterium]